MKWLLIIPLFAVILIGGCSIYTPPSSTESECTKSGGTVVTQMCCLSTSDFPNACLIGACGCSLDNSHEVKVCDCGEGKCWDGTKCIAS